MQEIVIRTTGAVIAASVAEALLPPGRLASAVKRVLGLVLTLTVCEPIALFIKGWSVK